MPNPFAELGPFFHDEEVLEELTAADEKILDAYEKALINNGNNAETLCAYISHGERCGFVSSGRLAYVQNRRRDKRVRATVRLDWQQGLDNGSYDRVKMIPAGGRIFLGCTVSTDAYWPIVYRTFRVIGCEVL